MCVSKNRGSGPRSLLISKLFYGFRQPRCADPTPIRLWRRNTKDGKIPALRKIPISASLTCSEYFATDRYIPGRKAMPDEARARSIADLPVQLATSPRTKAEARARYFNTGNAFDVRLPPVADHSFTSETARALDPATPTGLVACDLSRELCCAVPATTPLVLDRYA